MDYTKEYFEQYLYCDEHSPSGLRWKIDRLWGRKLSRVKIKAGEVAGSLRDNGYWFIKLNYKYHAAHRVVMALHGRDTQLDVDHKDGLGAGNIVENLRAVETKINTRNGVKRCSNTSGVTGVGWEYNTSRKCGRKPILYAVAQWATLDGKRGYKCFRVDRLGLLPAFKLACEHRAKMIEELNAQGAGYTDRHGK